MLHVPRRQIQKCHRSRSISSDKDKFQIDYKDEAVRGVLAVDAGNITWPAPQKPPPPPPPSKKKVELQVREERDYSLTLTEYFVNIFPHLPRNPFPACRGGGEGYPLTPPAV